ncbi:NAD(P)H-quinone oxidoreductase [Aeromicrobium sp. YIM 150415]|uniref:NAD(P)H-quinone oxidoreductase n=1 Tax=Aeromicrobium sp. YIM 150415 TaxID=2803912 RepID=UPI0019663D62|nr:NAD(P)H-quinone oxidoreductase [Aeromicrobium sp. YIM 150415]MBM9463749.1 NAD(P)H-quinone oxidoreductase [Aeromicrobium sp. YIM 150415]
MRAVVVNEPGGPDALEVVDVPIPEPGPGEVLIRVSAAGVNRADVMQRRGLYDPPPGSTRVLGLECSGEITAVGEGVDDGQVGRQVAALLTGGGYAEYVSVPLGQVAPIPAGIDLVTAAGLMETYSTVWSNVFMIGRLHPGETFLVHGGSSGIGTTAIQLATAFGATVVTTVGTAEKAQLCRDLGADHVINYRDEDFVEAMRAADLKADVILDIIGAKYLGQNVAALNTAGRLVVIGLQGGVKGELNLGALLAKRAAVTATSLRARPVEEKTTIVQQMTEQAWPLLEDGTVKPIVHATMDLSQVADAHRIMEESSHSGKILLTLA